MARIIDAITFHNEFDMFDIRYNILKDYVDEFVVVESMSSFGGLPKELNFPKIKDKYEKVKYYVNDDKYTEEEYKQAKESPNTGGVPRWMHEFVQKERIKNALEHLNDEDIVFVGDVDEIVDPKYYKEPPDKLTKFKLKVYTYFLNLRSNEVFCGTICTNYKEIKEGCLNHLRNNAEDKNTLEECGWHFTSQGGLEAVKQKIYDQYNPDVFNDWVYKTIDQRFGRADFIGRDFILKVDESEWPEYLKDNREKYLHLLK
jgi:beta-1,4-mannosyl-glycoprotein beta-1,4-N-acetylglucosaminyltransferase